MSRFIRRVLLSLLLLSSPVAATGQTFDQNTSPAEIISTTGLWRFHTGDDPRWADPQFDDSTWPLLRSDISWSAQPGYKDYRGIAWYRFRVVLPKSIDGPLTFMRPHLHYSYEIFANGQKIAACGLLPPRPRESYCPLEFYSVQPPSPGRVVTLAIRVWGLNDPYSGATLNSWLGTTAAMKPYEAQLHDRRQRENTMSEFMVLLQTLSALFLLAFFLIDRRHLEYLWFAVFLLFVALDRVAILYSDFASINSSLQGEYVRTLSVMLELAQLAFFYTLLKAKKSPLLYLATLGYLLDAIAGPMMLYNAWAGAHKWGIYLSYSTVELFTTFWVVSLVLRRARAGWLDARLLLLPVLIDQFFDQVSLWYRPFVFFFWRFQLPSIANLSILSEPFDVPLEALADLFFMLAMLVILINRFLRIRREEHRVASELEAARTVQKVMIPDELQVIPGLTITTAYHPAQEVGGDFFQILPLADGNTLIAVGDVSGKGLPAAMTVSLIVGALRTLSEYTSSPAEILAGLNRNLIGRGTGFTTGLVLRISPAGSLTLANAGHLAPYLNGQELFVEHSLPLGLDPDAAFLEQSVALAAGDHLTLLTDGIPEAASHGELFGFSRTEELSGQSPDIIADAARTFGQTDDITVLSVVFG